MRTEFRILAGVLACLLLAGGASAQEAEESESASLRILKAWKQMRRVDVNSPDFADAQQAIETAVAGLDASEVPLAASMLMDRYSADSINAAALNFFGKDFLTAADVAKILDNNKRSFSQRVLIRTYYSFFRREYTKPPISDALQKQLVVLLARRLASLAGKKVHYGEQRLLTHLCHSVLSRYGRAGAGGDEMKQLLGAMRKYAAAGDKSEPLTASIAGWLALRGRAGDKITSTQDAMAQLGHWDPLKRWKAAEYLARKLATGSVQVELVWAKLSDPRDEVRQAAVRVFGSAAKAGGRRVVPNMVRMLLHDRSVLVQSAAAQTLAARAGSAGSAIDPLLKALRTRRVGAKRTNNILIALSHLVGKADKAQKERLLVIAMGKLIVAPRGALQLFKALGAEAKPAVEIIKSYRDLADRFDRHYIDRHVLPAILPKDAKRRTGM